MKYLLPLLLTFSCSQIRTPAHFGTYQELSFKTQRLTKEDLRNTYPELTSESFEDKFNNSLERPLMFFRSYVNTYYAETIIRGPLKTPVFCYGDPHPENFGFISFSKTPLYVFNDLDDSGYCPLGLDVLRYFSALRLTVDDEGIVAKLAETFVQTVEGRPLENFHFKRPDLSHENIKNLSKYTENDRFIEKKNLVLLPEIEKGRIKKVLQSQLAPMTILDIASYVKNDGGSAGLKRYRLVVEYKGHKELIELKQLTDPAVSWTGVKQIFERTQTPALIWGSFPDYYGHIVLDGKLFLTRTTADDYIDLKKLSEKDQFKLLSYQVQLIAIFHRENLQKMGGMNTSWILENSRAIAQRYQDAFNDYKR